MDFEVFWKSYPRKVGKGAARRAWNRIKPDSALVERMLATLEWQREQEQWRDPQFIPHASTWLNGERWDDEPDVPLTKPAYSWHEECERLHGSKCGSHWEHGARMEQAS